MKMKGVRRQEPEARMVILTPNSQLLTPDSYQKEVFPNDHTTTAKRYP